MIFIYLGMIMFISSYADVPQIGCEPVTIKEESVQKGFHRFCLSSPISGLILSLVKDARYLWNPKILGPQRKEPVSNWCAKI